MRVRTLGVAGVWFLRAVADKPVWLVTSSQEATLTTLIRRANVAVPFPLLHSPCVAASPTPIITFQWRVNN